MTKKRRSRSFWVCSATLLTLGLLAIQLSLGLRTPAGFYLAAVFLSVFAGIHGFIFGFMEEGDRMRCPDCGHDIVVKPEVVVEQMPCDCGMTEPARIGRYFCIAFVSLMLAMFGGCWVDAHYNTEKMKYQIQEKAEKAGSEKKP